MASISIEFALAIAAAWAAPGVVYCLAIVIAAAVQKRIRGQACLPAPAARPPETRFHVLIPAHDEAIVIAAALSRLAQADYPESLVRYTVIADNCNDDTANIARASHQAGVLERIEPEARGKGHALNWAAEHILPQNDADAIVVIDADTLMDPGFLAAMDRAITACLPDERASFVGQGLYSVLNVGDNWRTALMAGALSLVHSVRPMARERWRTSVGLKGNGMCIARGVLERHKWPGESITEDLDYGLDLIELEGIRVRFVPGALVEAQMPSDRSAASIQRLRWERGRKSTLRRRAARLLLSGVLQRDRMRLDAALDLLCPPLAQLAAAELVWGMLVAAAAALRSPGWSIWASLCALNAAALAAYVIGGFKIAGAPAQAYRALLAAPVFVPWKIVTLLRANRQTGWSRTDRQSMPASASADMGAAEESP